MFPKIWCWLFGHKRRTKHVYLGVLYGRTEIENHTRCPRCGTPLEPI